MSSIKNRPQKQILLFDTTLRDGQQCPGAGMSFENNLAYARLACQLRVDVLEAGFAAASRTDFNIVHSIVSEIAPIKEGPIIASLCQLREQQFEVTLQALLPGIRYGKSRLHTYLPVDPQLMSASLGSYAENKEQIVKDVYRLIKMAVDENVEVEFSPEGYSRMSENFDFVTDVIRAAVSAGARVINCPDTIGGASHRQGQDYFVEKMNQHAAILSKEFPHQEIVWSVHCHNDFGLALENSMNAIFLGPATQIEGCINGIGERAGNVSLEQCILYLKYFGEAEDNEELLFCRADITQIKEISDFVAEHMLPRQPHWPISGDNASRHSSGGHTNAVLTDPRVYQPFDPTEVGKEVSLAFGPLSGSNHAKSIIEKHGFRCDEDKKAEIAQYIKDYYADRRKGITDEELMKAYFAYCASLTETEKTGEEYV
jgi:2-isopropylmalate synthase